MMANSVLSLGVLHNPPVPVGLPQLLAPRSRPDASTRVSVRALRPSLLQVNGKLGVYLTGGFEYAGDDLPFTDGGLGPRNEMRHTTSWRSSSNTNLRLRSVQLHCPPYPVFVLSNPANLIQHARNTSASFFSNNDLDFRDQFSTFWLASSILSALALDSFEVLRNVFLTAFIVINRNLSVRLNEQD